MASSQDLDLPIALRRATRQCAPPTRYRVVSAPIPAAPKTPSKPRPKKRVRFSDPGPELSHYEDTIICSTGLTPMIKRSSLGGPSPKRRRWGSPAAATARRPASMEDMLHEESADEADILSLPQPTGDGRRRRVRQNGLSVDAGTVQKMNTKPRARKENSAITAKAEAEVQRLRAELASRDAEIERLHNETIVQDTRRIVELEQQIEALRAELAQQPQLPTLGVGGDDEDGDADDGDNEDELPHSFYDWTLAARDPFSDSYMDVDDDVQDTSMSDVACSTPQRRRKSADAAFLRSATASFPTPPCTSPNMPATPCSVRTVVTPVTPRSHIGIQASRPDPEKEVLEAELTSLRLELTKLTATLENHAALETRLSEKLANASSSSSDAGESKSCQPGLEEHLNSVLQELSERTAALGELESSLNSLGFHGAEAGEIIVSITAGFREARLELEYLNPGEITLPLSSHGAQVLDLVLTCLRDLARRAREDVEAIDEYHALELSLRQQLTARVDAMESLRAEHSRTVATLRERDAHIADLEVGLDRLKGAAEGYRRDIVELENLVQCLEDSGKANEAKLQADLDKTQAQLSERVNVIAKLEAKLLNTLKQSNELEIRLKDLQRRKDAETKVRNKSEGAALALKDRRVSELRREIYDINECLQTSHETIMRLRIGNAKLEERLERAEEQEKLAKEAVATMKAELERVTAALSAPRRRTRSSSRENTGLATPEPQSGMFSASLARSRRKGMKRRSHDSGLGFLDEDQDDIELMS